MGPGCGRLVQGPRRAFGRPSHAVGLGATFVLLVRVVPRLADLAQTFPRMLLRRDMPRRQPRLRQGHRAEARHRLYQVSGVAFGDCGTWADTMLTRRKSPS